MYSAASPASDRSKKESRHFAKGAARHQQFQGWVSTLLVLRGIFKALIKAVGDLPALTRPMFGLA